MNSPDFTALNICFDRSPVSTDKQAPSMRAYSEPKCSTQAAGGALGQRGTGKYQVIETATGVAVGEGLVMGYEYAKYVCGVRDAFGKNEFFVRELN